MNRVLRVSVDDLDVTVEAGVTHRQLNKALANTGVYFWVDPGADATIGGMVATGASGTTTVRYGTMRETVRGLTVVLADGRVIRTGGRARKSSAGYDLTRLFVGSEGTLGVITEVTLRVHGLPDAVSAAVCPFESMDGAVRTVITTIQFGIPVARIELLDEVMIDAVNRYSHLSHPVKPTLFFEFHGTSEAGVSEHAATVQEIAAEHGAGEFQWATTTEARAKLWQARHNTLYAARAMRPGGKSFVTDVCVPISTLAECILETKKDLAASQAFAPLVGHVGDGNFHLNFVFDPDDPRQLDGGESAERPSRPSRARAGRHEHRRARDRHGKDRLSRRGARRGARGDEGDQARARSRQPDEPRQAVPPVEAGLQTRLRPACANTPIATSREPTIKPGQAVFES